MLPAKAKYLSKDMKRASERVNRPGLASPKDFLSMSLTTSPLRALHFIKANYSTSVFIDTMEFFFRSMWTPPNANLTKDDELAALLSKAKDAQGKLVFTDGDVGKIMDGRVEMKDVLKKETEKVVGLGAFGAPWLVAVNGKGEEDVFFGSDR
jgi:glutathione S-transferase kappa 1